MFRIVKIACLVLLTTARMALGYSGVVHHQSSSRQVRRPAALLSSPLFQRSVVAQKKSRQHYRTLYMASNDDDDKDSSLTTRTSSDDQKNLLTKLDDFGQSLKPRALDLKKKRDSITDDKGKRLWLTLRVCVLFALFIIYRAYRGFFVLLPAVFREVYQKMETSVDSPFTDDPSDINPETGKVRWRTRITVGVLSAIVTLTYVVDGLFRMLVKFVKTISKTSSITSSFEAAADEVESNEDKVRKKIKKEGGGGGTRSGKADIGDLGTGGLGGFE